MGFLLPIKKSRVGPKSLIRLFRFQIQVHELIRLHVRKRTKQNGVHNAEDRCVGANSKGKRQDGNDSEAWEFAHMRRP